MKPLDDERIKFYLKNRQQLEEWLAVKTDLSTFAHAFYASLRDDICNRVPDGVVVGEMSETADGSRIFRLRRRDWPQEGPAVELGWWHRDGMDFSPKDWVWCGLWAAEKSPYWQFIFDARERPGTKGYPVRKKSYPEYLMFRYLRHPDGNLWENEQLEAYGQSVITTVLEAWDDLAPLVDEAISHSP